MAGRHARGWVGALVAVGAISVVAASLGAPAAAATGGLSQFGTCSGFMSYVKRNASRIVQPWGLPGVGLGFAAAAEDGTPAPTAGEAPAPVAGVDFSSTNVQEAGVDEPDLVKTDGRIVYVLSQGSVRAVDVSRPTPQVVGTVDLPGDVYSEQMLLEGNRLIVLANLGGVVLYATTARETGDAPISILPPGPFVQQTQLISIDVSDPAGMTVVETLTVDGYLVASRLSGGTVRAVVASAPVGLEFTSPVEPGPAAEAEAKHANRDEIRSSRVKNWVPFYRHDDLRIGRTTTRRAVDCDEIARPGRFSGVGMLTVLTIDVERGLQPVDSDAIFAGGDTAYASPGSLYVATQRWADYPADGSIPPPSSGVTTNVHRFDISRAGETEYLASGKVDGYLIGQFAMSEHEGFLRVASTDQPLWWGDETARTESRVTVLAQRGTALEPVGEVTGLGKGERIYAVRFLGDTGYVVTFRQVDPLYVVDLSRPTAPVVAGELHILGFSSYLHPIGDGLLLGIGQDASPEGRVLGTQVSLFDVSNPASPALVDRRSFGQAWSEAEYDHHAFLWWAPTGLAVLPVQSVLFDETTGEAIYSGGAIGMHAGPGGLSEVGTVREAAGTIRRSLVVDGRLVTVSDVGVRISSLETLAEQGFAPFA